MTTDLRGCIPILCTPFFDDFSVDFAEPRAADRLGDRRGRIRRRDAGARLRGIQADGVRARRDHAGRRRKTAGRVPVVVSADGGSPEVAIDRALRAERAGANALMVLPASFVKPGPAALRDYYIRIGRAVEIPVIIQDAPAADRRRNGPALWADLAREVETIQYVKAEGSDARRARP